jgi:hypothetical protein
LDLGTNTQKYLDDPLYLGLRQRRVPEKEMTEFMDEFMFEMTRAFPKLLVQFEVRINSNIVFTSNELYVRTSPPTAPSFTSTDSAINTLSSMTISKEQVPSSSAVSSMQPSCHLQPLANL